MNIEKNQLYMYYDVLIKIVEPSLFDLHKEEYFTYDVYDPQGKEWCGVGLVLYKRPDTLKNLALVTMEGSDV